MISHMNLPVGSHNTSNSHGFRHKRLHLVRPVGIPSHALILTSLHVTYFATQLHKSMNFYVKYFFQRVPVLSSAHVHIPTNRLRFNPPASPIILLAKISISICSGADPGFGQGKGPSFRSRKLPT